MSLNDLSAEDGKGIEGEDYETFMKFKEKMKELLNLRAAAFNNLAAAQMKTEAFDQALRSVNSSLQICPDNVKALFRKGKILTEKGEVSDAIDVFKAALTIQPDSNTIRTEINKLAVKRKQEIADEKKLYQKMLQVDNKSNTSQSSKSSKSRESNSSLLTWTLVSASIGIAMAGTAFYFLNQWYLTLWHVFPWNPNPIFMIKNKGSKFKVFNVWDEMWLGSGKVNVKFTERRKKGIKLVMNVN